MRILNAIAKFASASYLYFGLAIILLEAGFAFLMMFVLPPASIAMLFVGLFTVLAVMIGSKFMSGIEHAVSRMVLRRGFCSRCYGEVISINDPEQINRWECARCHSLFEPSGRLASAPTEPHAEAVP